MLTNFYVTNMEGLLKVNFKLDAGQTLYPIATLGKGLVKLPQQVGLAQSAQLYPLRATCFDCKGGAVKQFSARSKLQQSRRVLKSLDLL